MKKRKNRLLRHDWQEAYFTLKGTQLRMHASGDQVDRTLEYIDIENYTVAPSASESGSKWSAALKAMGISRKRGKGEGESFSFQLIPKEKEATGRGRKGESGGGEAAGGRADEGVDCTGKPYHFAVKSIDERFLWMRELMLAKALKQKSQGFEIRVNGNMI